jgi:hypothetical protein
VIAWERGEISITSVDGASFDSTAAYRERIQHSAMLLGYVFLSTCPSCARLREPVKQALEGLPREQILTVSTEGDSVASTYWGDSKTLPTVSLRGVLPLALQYAPVIVCLERGSIKRVYIGDIVGLLEQASRALSTVESCSMMDLSTSTGAVGKRPRILSLWPPG